MTVANELLLGFTYLFSMNFNAFKMADDKIAAYIMIISVTMILVNEILFGIYETILNAKEWYKEYK